ncbi:hypothetical protein M8J77_020524 [Diaphorina citri]|nr:hypothetical protein M8J77_020524 [Diaphorina citri]
MEFNKTSVVPKRLCGIKTPLCYLATELTIPSRSVLDRPFQEPKSVPGEGRNLELFPLFHFKKKVLSRN